MNFRMNFQQGKSPTLQNSIIKHRIGQAPTQTLGLVFAFLVFKTVKLPKVNQDFPDIQAKLQNYFSEKVIRNGKQQQKPI